MWEVVRGVLADEICHLFPCECPFGRLSGGGWEVVKSPKLSSHNFPGGGDVPTGDAKQVGNENQVCCSQTEPTIPPNANIESRIHHHSQRPHNNTNHYTSTTEQQHTSTPIYHTSV